MNSLHVTSNREKIAMRISWYSIAVNVFLSLGKFVAGIFGHSAAMVSDAIHSASDVFATFIVMAGIKISGKASDEDHQYGHERLECVASILLSVILALTGLAIGYAGIEKIMHQDTESIAIPTFLPLAAAIISIVVKEAMYWYTRHYALMLESDALMADAWHHRSDSLSSVGSFIGILGARMGYPILDPIAMKSLWAPLTKWLIKPAPKKKKTPCGPRLPRFPASITSTCCAPASLAAASL